LWLIYQLCTAPGQLMHLTGQQFAEGLSLAYNMIENI